MISKAVQATVSSKKGKYIKQQIREEEDKIIKARQKEEKMSQLKAIAMLKDPVGENSGN